MLDKATRLLIPAGPEHWSRPLQPGRHEEELGVLRAGIHCFLYLNVNMNSKCIANLLCTPGILGITLQVLTRIGFPQVIREL